MSDGLLRRRWRLTPVNVIPGLLVLGGFLLADVNWAFIALVGLGAFGPGVLRELGWLRDKDEFQLAAARRAGYHGFLAAGLVGFLLIAYYRSHPELRASAGDPVELVVAVLWFTWLLSSLLSYWGARRMAVRMLVVFGGAWLAFNVLANWQAGPVAVAMQSLLAVPFFAAAWLAGRLPRLAGAFLLISGVFFVLFFRLHRVVDDLFARGAIFVLLFFVGPLVVAGLALVRRRTDQDE